MNALPGELQPLVEGSKAMLQCFVPATTVEVALPRLDALLNELAFERLGIRMVKRFDSDVPREEVEDDSVWKGIREVIATDAAYQGLLFTADQSARWKNPDIRRQHEHGWRH